jgi:hypothetical protein
MPAPQRAAVRRDGAYAENPYTQETPQGRKSRTFQKFGSAGKSETCHVREGYQRPGAAAFFPSGGVAAAWPQAGRGERVGRLRAIARRKGCEACQ